jgi:fructokinase
MGSNSMTDTTKPLVIGLGELLWDCFADSRRPGGAPANVAFQANQLGCRGIVCTRVGRDALGDELIAFLASQGLSTEAVQRDREYPTGTVTVDTSQPDRPRFVIHENVAWDYLELDASWRQQMSRAAAVCFGTLAQRGAVSRKTIHGALEAAGPDCLIVYDVNLRQRWYDRSWIEQSLAKSKIAKLNGDEVGVLADLLELGSAEHAGFAEAMLKRFPVEAVCITRAEKGCLLVTREETIDSPGVPVQVADAVGAGDAFTAALIVSRLRGWPLAAQAAFANRVGALVASRPGAMPVLRDEFAALLKRCE